MALNSEQIDILTSKYITGLYDDLESEVIKDIARRVDKMQRYTETAEIMAKSMREQGYSPSKIQAEVLKKLNADKGYQAALAQNTRDYKQEVKEIIEETVRMAKLQNDQLVAEAGDMAWNDDMQMWQEHGVDLKQPNGLSQLFETVKKQTEGELKNITRTTAFKNTVFGNTGIINAYQRALDLAMIKASTGTFTAYEAGKSVIKELAQGIRTIDYNGRSYHLDTAVKMCLRTGVSQLAGKITEENIKETGVNLVYVDAHAGARPEHALWQGKVYTYSGRPTKKYPDFWDKTGYGTVTGLKGVNCTHDFWPYWEGDPVPEYEEPDPIKIDGREYTMYEATQKQRQMERAMRATRRELEAMQAYGATPQDISALQNKLAKQMWDYREFSNNANLRAKTERTRVVGGTSDLTRTKYYKGLYGAANPSKYGSKSNDLHYNAPFNAEASFEVKVPGISKKANANLTKYARKFAEEGSKTGKEYAVAIDKKTGKKLAYQEGEIGACMDAEFFDALIGRNNNSVVILHNHTNNSAISWEDAATLILNEKVCATVVSSNNGVIRHAAGQIKTTTDESLFSEIFFDTTTEEIDKQLIKQGLYDKVKENLGSLQNTRTAQRVMNILQKYFKYVEDSHNVET